MKGDGSLVDIGGRIQVLSGFAFPSTGFHESEGVPLIRIRDLSKGRTEVRFRGKYDAVFEVRAGDVLVGMDGDFSAVRWSGGLALLNQRVCKVAPKADCDLDDGYLYHSLQPQLDAIHRRTPQTTVRHLSGGDIYGIRLPLPPLPEQQLIASILDTVDEVIRKTEEVIAKLQQMKQGLLHDLLTRGIDDNGELRDPDRHPEQFKDSELGRIPKDWEVEALGDVYAERSKNGLYKPQHHHGRGQIMVQMGNIFGALDVSFEGAGRVQVSASELETFGLQNGDLLFGRRSLVLEGAGKCSLVRDLPEPSTFESSIVRVRVDRTRVDPEYAALYLSSESAYRDRRRFIRQVAVSGVSGGDIAEFLFLRPSVGEQEKICVAVAMADARTQREESELSKLRLLKSGLMDDLLTGRVRVTDLLPTTTTP